MRILLSLTATRKRPGLILFEEKLCEIQKDTFEKNKTKYLIRGEEVVRLSPDTARPFGFFKRRDQPLVEEGLKEKFGKNFFKIESPGFLGMFLQHAVSPFFVFQIFCGILWCLDEYIYQALFTIVMLFLIEAGLVLQRLINLKQFRTMNHSSIKIEMEDGSIRDSLDLFPGDIIRIKETLRLPCDVLLLRGSCAVNEAMLSGESVPLTKEDIQEVDNERILDLNRDKKHILFAGTDLVKVEDVLGYVLLTGFDTQQGELIKKMMGNEEVSVNDKEAFGFIGVLLVFAVVAGGYTWREGLKMGKTSYKIFLEVILIITNVVPTELPLELSMAVNSCVKSLMDLGVFCLEPFRIPMAGKVDVCCFDKTGTLTETQMELSEVKYPSKSTVGVLRNCHSMVLVENKLRGDPLEISINQYLTSIAMSSGDDSANSSFFGWVRDDLTASTFPLKKYLFDSDLKRMTVVYESNKKVFVGMKGAPEVVESFLKDVPTHYSEFKKYAEDGFRVIALASKPYRRASHYTREDVEKDLDFCGFILFRCRLKHNARETVQDLKESGHRVVMITGDNLLTAQSVANQLGIEGEGVEGDDIETILLHEESKDIECSTTLDSLQDGSVQKKSTEADCPCDTKMNHSPKPFESYGVFARASPSHKERILALYNKRGSFTLMCGDGTNDVGALKTAHIGVALVEDTRVKVKKVDEESLTPQKRILRRLEEELNETTAVKMGDASVAAPFTAKTGSLESILDIIRQGRSALVTTIQMYKILGLNALVNAFSLSVLDCMGIRFGEFQLVASGILIAFAFMFLTSNQPLKEISRKRPLSTIFTPYLLFSVALQVLVHIGAYYFVIHRVTALESLEYQEKFSPSLLNSSLFYLSTAQQLSTFLVNYIGRPFRESLLENKKLSTCLLALFGFLLYLLFEMNPEFNLLMEVVSLGDLKSFMVYVIAIDILLCFILEKVCFYAFLLNK